MTLTPLTASATEMHGDIIALALVVCVTLALVAELATMRHYRNHPRH